MNGKTNIKKVLAIVTLLMLFVALFTACNPSTPGGGGTVKPPVEDPGNSTTPGENTDNSSTKIMLTGEEAVKLLLDSIERSKEINKMDASVLNFDFTTYLDLSEELIQCEYAFTVKGSIDLYDNVKNLLSIEIRKNRTGEDTKLILGLYANGDSIYIDLRGSERGDGIHVYKVDDMDLSWAAGLIHKTINQLDLSGFFKDFRLDALIDLSTIPVISDLLAGNLSNILAMIVTECYTVDNGKGSVSLVMPTVLNSQSVMGVVLGVVGSLLNDDIYEIVELVFGWDLETAFNKVSSREVGVELFFRADILDNVFQQMSLGVCIDNENPLDIDLGVKNISLGRKPSFNLPDFTNVETERYSFTTLNADLDLNINAAEHTYTIDTIDTAIGGLISKMLLESGNSLTMIQGLGSKTVEVLEDVPITLRLKLRAEIDLKDNDNSKILLEIYGKNNSMRAGVYYIGSEQALFIDLSGMGSGRYKVDSYPREISKENPNGRFIKRTTVDDKGKEKEEWVLYNPTTDNGEQRYDVSWIDTPLNLTTIIKDSLNKLVSEIPSLMSIISGLANKDAKATADNENNDIAELISEGKILIPHYPNNGAATADEPNTEIDTMALIKKILLCTKLVKGDPDSTFNKINKIIISLTDDVIQTIAGAIKPGLELPFTKLDLEIVSEGIGLEHIILYADIGDRKAPEDSSDRKLISLVLDLGVDYGNFKNDYAMPEVNDPTKPYLLLPLSKDLDGNLKGLSDLTLALDGEFRLQANQAVWDLSPIEQILYGLILQIEVQDDVDIHYGFSIKANLNLSKLINKDTLNAIEARIELTKNPDNINAAPTILLYLSNGKLYIDALKAGLPLMMIDIGKITGGDLKILTKVPDNAYSTAEEPAAKSDVDVVGIIVGILSGVMIDSDSIEIAFVTDMLGTIIGLIKPELADKPELLSALPSITEDSGLKINFDGLNLSELYLNLQLGIEDDDNRLDLGLGLGHVLVGLNKLDLAPNNLSDYVDVLSDLNIYLGVNGSLNIDIAEGEIDINNMLGALLVDMASGATFNPYIDIEEDIKQGIDLNVKISLDLANVPEFNTTQIVIEVWSHRTGKLLLGAYYENRRLYVDGSTLGIEKFYTDVDIIELIQGLINKDETPAEGAAYATEEKKPISLSGIQALLIISDTKMQAKVISGLTGLIVGLISDKVVGGDSGKEWMIAILENEGMDGFDLPEIGASVTIDYGKQKGKPLFNALSLGIELTMAKNLECDPTFTLGVWLSDLILDVNAHEVVYESNIDKTQFVSVDFLNNGFNNLYFETIGSIDLGAMECNPEIMNYNLGEYLAQFADQLKSKQVVDASGNPIPLRDENNNIVYEKDENGNLVLDASGNPIPVYLKDVAGMNGLFDYLCRILIKFGIINDLHKTIGFRIAANLAINTLMGENGADIVALLEKSDLALELYSDEYGKGNKVIGIYLKEGTLYINLDGNLVSQTKLKINLITSGILDKLTKKDDTAETTALSTADEENGVGLIPANIVDVLNGALKSIGINNDSISVNIGANLLGAVIGLVVGGSGYTMPQLNEDNSYLRWDTPSKTLKLSIGLDPVYFGITLGGFAFGFSKGDAVNQTEEELNEYLSIADLSTLSLDTVVGIDLKIPEGVIPFGELISKIATSQGTALDFGADISVQQDIEMNLRLYLKANIDLTAPEKTQIMLEIFNEPPYDVVKKIIGIYLDGETLYVDPGIINMAKFKVTDFDILANLLDGVFAGLVSKLQGLGGNGSGTAMAAAEQISETELLEILFSLSEHNIKIILTERLILGLFELLLPDSFTSELSDALDSLNLSAGVELNTSPIKIGVFVDTAYLSLGIFIDEPQLSIEPIEHMFDTVLSNTDQYIDYREYDNLYAEVNLEIRYRLYEGEHDLTSLIEDLMELEALKSNATVSDILNKIILNMILTDNKYGRIGIKIMTNIDTTRLFDALLNGDKLDANSILSMIEASIVLTLGEKTVQISLMNSNLYIKLDEIGGPNLKIENLVEFFSSIGQDKPQEIADGSALATADNDGEKSIDIDLINTILNNAIRDISLGREHGLDIALAPQILAVVLGTLLKDTISFSDETLSNFYLVDEHTDNSAYKLATKAQPNEIMDIRDYVFFNGNYVLYDEENVNHANLDIYKKIRHSGITYKITDCRNNNDPSFNIDLAFKNGLDAGLSVYGYGIGVEKIDFSLDNMENYPSISNIMEERIYLSTILYIELLSDKDICYNISEIIGLITEKIDVDVDLTGLASMLSVLQLKEFNNRLDIRISADLILDDIINNKKFDTMNIAIELIKFLDNGEIDVRGGLYLTNGTLYIDLRNYNDSPVIAVPDVVGIISKIVENMKKGDISADALATADENNALSTLMTQKGALNLLIGSKGLEIKATTELVNILISTLLKTDVDFAEIFGEFNAEVGIHWENAKSIRDISLDVGINIGELHLGLGLYNIEVGINTTKDIVPSDVISDNVEIDDLVVEVGVKLYVGANVAHSSIDIGGLLASVIPDLTLMLNVPNEKGALVGIIIDISASIDLNNFANTEARIDLYGVAGVGSQPVLLGKIYYTQGEICIDLSALGIDKVKITGLDISELLGDSLMSVLGVTGEGTAAAAAEAIDPKLAAILLTLNGNSIALNLGKEVFAWILKLEALSKITEFLPAEFDISALLDIQYLDPVTKKFDIRIDLKAIISKILGIDLSIYDIYLGFTGRDLVDIDTSEYVEILELGLVHKTDDDGNLLYEADGSPTMGLGLKELKLETLSVALSLKIRSFMQGDENGILNLDALLKAFFPDVEDIYAAMHIPTPVENKIDINIAAEIKIMELINIVSAENIDIGALLKTINANIEIITPVVDVFGNEYQKVLLGVYLNNGDAYLRLDGLGLPNVKLENQFIMDIINAVSAGKAVETNAMSTAVDTTKIGGIVSKLITGITLANKALMVVINDNYLQALIGMIFPEVEVEVPSFSSDINAITVNLNRGYYVLESQATRREKSYVDNYGVADAYDQYVKVDGKYVLVTSENKDLYADYDKYLLIIRDGLVEVDLTFYDCKLDADLLPPHIGFASGKIALPELKWSNGAEINGLTLTLRGKIGVDTAERKSLGIGEDGEDIFETTVGDVLGGLLGDLSAGLLLDEFSINLNYEITAALAFSYSIENKTFEINKLDLAIDIIRVKAGGASSHLLGLYYSNEKSTIYLDLSHFGAGNIAVTGINLSDLLNGLLGDKETTDAIAEALSTGVESAAYATAENELDPYTMTAVIAELGYNHLLVTLSAKIVNAIICRVAGESDKNIGAMIPNIALKVEINTNPFELTICLQLQDNKYKKIVDLSISLKGFDYTDGTGSELFFEYKDIFGDSFPYSDYKTMMNINLNANKDEGESVITSTNDILNLSLNLEIALKAEKTEIGEEYDWTKYFCKLFGLTEEELKIIIGVYEKQSNTKLNISIDAAINLGNLLGPTMSLAGTEIRIALDFKSDILADELQSNEGIVITIIGEDTDGNTGIYLDLSGYRNKGKHKLSIDIVELISKLSNSDAMSVADDVNTGLLSREAFDIINSLIGSLKLSDGRISVNVKHSFLTAVFDLALADNPYLDSLDMPPVEGGIYIDITNLTVGLNLSFEKAMSIEVKISDVKLQEQEDWKTYGTFRPIDADNEAVWTDLCKLKLNIDLLGELTYKADRSTTSNPPIDLSELFSLIKIDGVPLMQNPLFQLRVAKDLGTTYIVNTHIYLDLENFNNLNVTLEVWNTYEDGTKELMIGVYLDSENVYIDLKSLGIPRISLGGVNLGDVLEEALGEYLGHDANASAEYSAMATALGTRANILGDIILNGKPYAYIALVFQPELFALGVNAKLIDAVINIIKKAQGEEISSDTRNIPDLGDIAVIGNSTTAYILETDANGAEKHNIRDRYVKVGDKYILLTDLNKETYADTNLYPRYLKLGGKLLPELAIRISDGFYGSIKLNDIHVNANLENPFELNWETANEVFKRIEAYTGNDDFVEAYNLKTKEIGIGQVNFGLNISMQLMSQHSVFGDEDYGDSFQYYLAVLLSTLLGGDIENYRLNLPDNVIGYELILKLSANIGDIYNVNTGLDIGALLNSEIFIEFKIGAPYNSLLIGLYKQENDNAIYADLSGLGLPKIKVIGLGSILAGIGTAMADVITGKSMNSESINALATADDVSAPPAFAEIAIEQGRVEISLEMEVLRQVFVAMGLEIGEKTYTCTKGTKSASATYSTITIRKDDGTVDKVIPLPNLDVLRLSLDMEKKINSIGITIGLDNVGNAMVVKLDNFALLFGDVDFITNTDFASINDNPDAWGSIILTDIFGVSAGNIVKGVLDSIDPNITLQLNKKVTSKETVNGKENSNYTPSYTTVAITRTKGEGNGPDETNSNGDKVYGGKLAVNIDITNQEQRHAAVWLFNNSLYGDFGDVAGALTGFVGIFMDLRKMKLADLNIVELVTKDDSSAAAAAVNALTAADSTEEPDTLETIKSIVKGIQIDWWYNSSVPGTLGDMRYSTIRIDLKAQVINELLLYVYYMLYTLQYTIVENDLPAGDISLEAFKLLTYEQKLAIVTEYGTINIDGATYNKVDAYKAVPYYVRQLLGNLLEGLAGSTVAGWVKSGNFMGIGTILLDIINGLLPLPLLDDSKPNFIEIVLDKLGENGIISEIGIYLNKEKSVVSGNTISRVNVNSVDGDNAEIMLKVNKLYTLSVSSIDWYNNSEKEFGKLVGIGSDLNNAENTIITRKYVVADAFNPVELGFAATNSPTTLPQRVDATFTGISAYTSKGQNGQNKEDAWIELGGTSIIWDVSEVNLTPGSTDSFIYGYALNKLVAKIPVVVGSASGYMSLYGYLDSNNNFVRTDKIIIDPMGKTSGSVTVLPENIVIMQNNGELQLLSTKFVPAEYDKDTNDLITAAQPSATINGKTVTAAGKFGWINSDDEAVKMGGNAEVSFWYKVNRSAKITVSTTIEYVNRNIEEALLPAGTEEQIAKFAILDSGDALDFTAQSKDIKANISSLKTINVVYTNGEIGSLDVLEWQFDKFVYDITAPYKGASGSVTVTVGEPNVYTQDIVIPISVTPREVDSVDSSIVLSYNPYEEFKEETLLPSGKLDVTFKLSRIIKETKPVSVRLSSYIDGREGLVKPANITYDKGGKFYVYAVIGNADTGIQTVKLPVNIETKIVKSVNYTIQNPFDTEALAKMKGNPVTVVFNDNSIGELIVQNDVSLMYGAKYTNNGGIYSAELIVGNQYAGAANNQKVTATISVMRKVVTAGSVKFFTAGDENEIDSYTTDVINIDPENFDYNSPIKVKITHKNVLNESIDELIEAKWAKDTAEKLRTQVLEDAVEANAVGNMKLGLIIGSQTVEVNANVLNRNIISNTFEDITDYTIHIENMVTKVVLPTSSTVNYADGTSAVCNIVWSSPVYGVNPDGSVDYGHRTYTASITGVNFSRQLPNKIIVVVDTMASGTEESNEIKPLNSIARGLNFVCFSEGAPDVEATPNIDTVIINPYQYANYEAFKAAVKTIRYYDTDVDVIWPSECFYTLKDGNYGYLGGAGVVANVTILDNMLVNVPFEVVPVIFNESDLINSGTVLVDSVLTTNYFETQKYPEIITINGYTVKANWSDAPALTVNGCNTEAVIKVGNDEAGWQSIKVMLNIADKSIDYIINGAYSSLIFDPMYESTINYPDTVEVMLKDGTIVNMSVVIPESAISLKTETTQTGALKTVSMIDSGVKPDAEFEFTYNGIMQKFNVPVTIVDRTINSDTLPAQIIISNPYAYNTDAFSSKFSFPKKTTVIFANGKSEIFDISWGGIKVNFTAEEGNTFNVTATYGSSLCYVTREIECSINKVNLSLNSTVVSEGVNYTLQSFINATLNKFEAYPDKNISEQNAKLFSNYFKKATFRIGSNNVELDVKWLLATLNYDFNGGARTVVVEVGNEIGGFQTLRLTVNINPWIIESVDFSEISALVGNSASPLDPFSDKVAIFNQINGKQYNVTFTNGKTKTLTPSWNFSAVVPTLDGGIFNAVATFFEGEYASKQVKELTFTFYKRTVLSVTSADSQTLLVDTATINPYDSRVTLPNEVKVYFKKSYSGTNLGEDTLNFGGNNAGNGNLTWNKANFRPNIVGDLCEIECRITKNNVTYIYDIYYEVYALLASKIDKWGAKYSNANWNIDENGNIDFVWEINPLEAVKSDYVPSNTNIGVTFNVYDYGTSIVGKWVNSNKVFDIKSDNTYTYKVGGVESGSGSWYIDDADGKYKYTYTSGSATKVSQLPFVIYYESYIFNDDNTFIRSIYGVDTYGTYSISDSNYLLTYKGTSSAVTSAFTTDMVVDGTYKTIKSINNVMKIDGLGGNLSYSKEAIRTEDTISYNFAYVSLSMSAAYKVTLEGGNYAASIRLGNGEDLNMAVKVLDKTFTVDESYRNMAKIGNNTSEEGALVEEMVPVTYTADNSTGYLKVYWEYVKYNTTTTTLTGDDRIKRYVYDDQRQAMTYTEGDVEKPIVRYIEYSYDSLIHKRLSHYNADATISSKFDVGTVLGDTTKASYVLKGYVGRVYDSDGRSVALDTGIYIDCTVTIGDYVHNLDVFDINGVWESTDGTYTCIAFDKNNSHSMRVVTGTSFGSETPTGEQIVKTTTYTYDSGNSRYEFAIDGITYYVTVVEVDGKKDLNITMNVTPDGEISYSEQNISFKKISN